MGRYKHGDNNVICDYSGYKYKASECRLTWDGLFVHKDWWEPRQKQDFIRAKQDDQTVPITRSESEDVFMTEYPTADDL